MLDYVALAILIAIILLVVYGLVAAWGIPYEIAKSRNHPHQDAIRAATWLSFLTLGTLWPFLWIWALAYHPDRGWGVSPEKATPELAATIARFESRLEALERAQQKRVTYGGHSNFRLCRDLRCGLQAAARASKQVVGHKRGCSGCYDHRHRPAGNELQSPVYHRRTDSIFTQPLLLRRCKDV